MRDKLEKLKIFLREVAQETKKVTWPTPREIAGATSVVIFSTVALAGLLAAYDWVISMALRAVLR